MKVLLFEINELVREVMVELLKSRGHEILASPPLGAVGTGELLRRFRPDVVVLCWVCCGNRIIAAIRQVDRHVPIGIMSDIPAEVVADLAGSAQWIVERPPYFEPPFHAIEESVPLE